MEDMQHRRDGQKRVKVLRVIALVLIIAALVAGTWFRYLMQDVVPGSKPFVLVVLTVAWWCFAAWLAATLLGYVVHRFVFPSDGQPKRRKILADLAAGLIYLGAALGILNSAFHQPIGGLVATSGIVALVLGLALQNTLGDLFSGIALNIEGPFHAGDWITVDRADAGQVIEINWRATRIRDRSGDITIIPNSQIAKSHVTNHCLPERLHAGSISIDFDTESPADRVEQVLVAAVLKAKHVLSDPAPEVTLDGIRSRSASYTVSFYVVDFANIPLAQSEAFKQLLPCVSNAGLRLARAQTEVLVVEGSKSITPALST